MRFLVTMERDESGMIVVECPSIPGCISQGRTEEEAIANIREAIALHLEGEDLTELGFSPEPTIIASMELEAVA